MDPNEPEELAKLNEELDARENALAQLLEQKEFMLDYELFRLEADYMYKVGNEEYEISQIESVLKRNKQKIKLIREQIENKEPVDMEKINAQIEWIFALDDQEGLKKEKWYLSDDEERPTISDENFKKLKGMYYNFAKRLHPDLNHNLTQRELNIWHRVQSAYEKRSIDEMNLLYALYEKTLGIQKALTQKDDIQKRIDKIHDLMHQTFAQIAGIEQSFPFTFEEHLSDEQWIKDKAEINQRIKNQLIEEYSITYELISILLNSVGMRIKLKINFFLNHKEIHILNIIRYNYFDQQSSCMQ